MSAPDVRIKLVVDGTPDVIAAFKKLQDESQKAGKGIENGFLGLTKTLGGVKSLLGAAGIAAGGFAIAGAFAEAVRSVTSFVARAGQAAEDIGKLEEALGGGIGQIGALSVAAQISNVDIGQLRAGLGQFVRQTAGFEQGAGKAATALRALGISAESFRGASVAEQFRVVAETISPLEAGPRKAALAMQLFGRNALSLIPLMNTLGREGFEKLQQQFDHLFSPEGIARVRQLRDEMKLLELQAQGLAVQFLSGLAPAITTALTDISGELTGNGISAVQQFGQAIGKMVALAILAFDNLADRISSTVASLVQQTRLIASATVASGRISAEQLDAAVRIFNISKDFDERSKRRAQQFADIQAGKFVAAPTTPSGGAIGPLDESAIKERQTELKAAVDAELKIQQAGLKAQDAAAKLAFEQGLTSIRGYYAERRRIQREALEAEVAAVRARAAIEVGLQDQQQKAELSAMREHIAQLEQRREVERSVGGPEGEAAASKTLLEIERQRKQLAESTASFQSDSEVRHAAFATQSAAAEAEVRRLTIESRTQTLQLDAEETKALRDAGQVRVDLERKLAKLRGDDHRAELDAIDSEVAKEKQALAQLAGERAGSFVGPPAPQTAADTTALEAIARAQEAQAAFDRDRQAIQERLTAGAVSQAQADVELATLDRDRVPVLVQLSDLAAKLADATGRAATLDAAAVAVDHARLSEQQALATAQANFNEQRRIAEREVASLSLEETRINDQVSAGLLSQVDAEQQLIEVRRAALAPLQEQAALLQRAAADSGNAELQRIADEFSVQVERIALSVAAVENEGQRIKVAFQDALTNGLADFFSTGIQQSKNLLDAVRSMAAGIVASVQSMIAQILAKKIVGGIFDALGLSGGGPVSAGAPQTSARGNVPFASGGQVRGPGSETSDSIPVRLSDKEFVVRASVAKRPAVAKFLHWLNRGKPEALRAVESADSILHERRAIARSLVISGFTLDQSMVRSLLSESGLSLLAHATRESSSGETSSAIKQFASLISRWETVAQATLAMRSETARLATEVSRFRSVASRQAIDSSSSAKRSSLASSESHSARGESEIGSRRRELKAVEVMFSATSLDRRLSAAEWLEANARSRQSSMLSSALERRRTASDSKRSADERISAEFRAALFASVASTRQTAALSGWYAREIHEAIGSASDAQIDSIERSKTFALSIARRTVEEVASLLLKSLGAERFSIRASSLDARNAQTRAGGGFIRGAGTATSDSIPAWLSDREFVVRAAAVQRPGVLRFLHRLNIEDRGALELIAGPASYLGAPVALRTGSSGARFSEGGLVVQAGAAPGSSLDARITVGLEDGLVERGIETPEGARSILRVLRKSRRSANAALSG